MQGNPSFGNFYKNVTQKYCRKLGVVKDQSYTQLESLVEVNYTSLDHFTRNNPKLSNRLPVVQQHFKRFIVELGQSDDVVKWIATFKDNEDPQHEVDILKGSGDHRLVAVLGDLDAVKSWLTQLGLVDGVVNK